MPHSARKVHKPIWLGALQVAHSTPNHVARIASSWAMQACTAKPKRRQPAAPGGQAVRLGPVTNPMKNAISCQPHTKTA